jgi:hypothetical protein
LYPRDIFSQLEDPQLRRENLTIGLRDSKELKVEDKGDVDITRGGPPVILHEALIVPGSVQSLLSLGQATQRVATEEFKRDMRWIKHGDHVVIEAQQSGHPMGDCSRLQA